jgi:dinuclear metal center YbgI/SA1388 family protein
MIPLERIAAAADAELRINEIPDYAPALNGVQVGHRGPVRRIAAAVDCSLRTITAAAAADANLLVVHHGLFWGGNRTLTGAHLRRVRALLDHDIALYSAHLPLDVHPTLGNSALLASALGLKVDGGFARYETVECGVRGVADLDTMAFAAQVTSWAAPRGHRTIKSEIPIGHRTRRWAICSGSGANAETLAEAYRTSVDTLIVGEGPHWSAVEAVESGLVIIYAGHYATETLGVTALARHLGDSFGLPWTFLDAPTGL